LRLNSHTDPLRGITEIGVMLYFENRILSHVVYHLSIAFCIYQHVAWRLSRFRRSYLCLSLRHRRQSEETETLLYHDTGDRIANGIGTRRLNRDTRSNRWRSLGQMITNIPQRRAIRCVSYNVRGRA